MILSYDKLNDISGKYGNAFYLLDSQQFENNYLNLKKAFSGIYPNFNIAYSYKTNYIPNLCKIVDKHNGYAEVVSDMEMEIAIKIGVKLEKIIWNGPVKNAKKVEELLVGGGTVNIDSFEELNLIKEIAKRNTEKKIHIGLRCNFDIGDGVVSRFGFDVEEPSFKEIINYIKETPNLYLINLQCHFAKRNIDYWPARATGMIKIVDLVEKILKYIPKRIDLGGGLYGNMEESLKKQFTTKIPSYEDYAKAVAKIMIERFPNAEPELLIEPGSALAGDSMKFVGKVETIKRVRGKDFITILGSQKNISMSGVNPPIKIFSNSKEKVEVKNADIVGYTCIESDILYKNYSGKIARGDFVVISNCGSYSIVMKPPFIMPNFPVVDICKGDIELVKKEEKFDDLFHTYIM